MLEEITSGEYENTSGKQFSLDIALVEGVLEVSNSAHLDSLWIPDTLAIVSRADLDAHNAEMERLQAEVEALQQEREPAPPTMRERLDDCNAEVARLQALPVWQPVDGTWEYIEPENDGVWTSTITSESDGATLTIVHTEGDEYERVVDLPDGYRLCRLVSQEASND